MLLITGATGNFGRATIDFLLQKGVPAAAISALVRDETKAAALAAKGIQLRIGSYDSYPSLVSAFQGVDKLLLISGTDIFSRSAQHANVVQAAQNAGVKHIFYTSVERRNETATSPMALVANSHLETEKAIKASGLAYTFFRNNVYLDVLPRFFGERVLETGIFLPAGDTKSAFALRREMAEAVANVLAGEGHENKAYSLGNSENVSFAEMAEALSQATGKDVRYTSPSVETFTATLTRAGLPVNYVNGVARFSEGVRQGEFEVANQDLEQLLGRKPTTAKEFLQQVYALAN